MQVSFLGNDIWYLIRRNTNPLLHPNSMNSRLKRMQKIPKGKIDLGKIY